MIGLFVGSYIIGYAGDKFGRKKTMMISLLFLIIGGSLAGIMPYYSLYVVYDLKTFNILDKNTIIFQLLCDCCNCRVWHVCAALPDHRGASANREEDVDINDDKLPFCDR